MLKRVVLGIIALLVVIQAIRPRRNESAQAPGRNDFLVMYAPPAEVRQVLRDACYDCHSDNTRYPWYANVQPVGWWLAQHIRGGKRHLDFSQFGAYSARQRGRELDRISDQISNRKMPLRSYTWIHKDARLTDKQVDAVSAWIDDLHDKLDPLQ